MAWVIVGVHAQRTGKEFYRYAWGIGRGYSLYYPLEENHVADSEGLRGRGVDSLSTWV